MNISDGAEDEAAILLPSVGCPMGCNFCSTSHMFGGKGKHINFYETGDDLFRIMKQLSGEQPFKVSSITEVHARYLREGRIKIDKTMYTEPVTYHDPCQIARNAGVIDEARYILRQLTNNFREMTEDARYNWCCGGGGGLVALGEETLDFRMKSAKVKVDQVKASGAKILSTACENCHTQLSNLNDHYKMGVDVHFLSSMVADALVGDGREDAAS
jgi:Fe-S oxidoreductase